MKRLLMFSIIITFLTVNWTVLASERADRDDDGLIGPVKSVATEEVIYSFKFGEWMEKHSLTSVSQYDRPGHKVIDYRVDELPGFTTSYNEKGHLYYSVFDSGGRLVKQSYYLTKELTPEQALSLDPNYMLLFNVETWKYDEQGRILEHVPEAEIKYIYSYDNNGLLKEWVIYNAGEKASNTIYKYDATGQLVMSSTYDPQGVIFGRRIYSLDGKGNKTETIYGLEGNVWMVYVTDSQGRTILEETHDEDGKLRRTLSTEYLDTGGRVETDLIIQLIRTVSHYDGKGNITETDYFHWTNGTFELGQKVTYQNIYDDSERLAQVIHEDESTEYEYDSHGNWISMKTWKKRGDGSKEPVSASIRSILYY